MSDEKELLALANAIDAAEYIMFHSGDREPGTGLRQDAKEMLSHALRSLATAQAERDAALRTIQAREVLAGATGLDMNETVVEACRRTAESFRKERDNAQAERDKMKEALTTLDEAAVRVLDLNLAGYYIDHPEHCPEGRIDIELKHLAQLREESRKARSCLAALDGGE